MSATSQDLIKFLRGLRQVREYTSEPVSDEAIQDILEVGRWSGSGGNRQPTEIVVVRAADFKNKLEEWGAKPPATAPVAFLIIAKDEASALEEGRLAERLLLAARAHGLGAAIATIKNDGPEEAKRQLGIPDGKHARVVVAVGHTDRAARAALPPRTEPARKPLSEFAHWERF